MSTKFGVFVPQGWRLDLTEIEDPIEQFEAMTNVARIADEGVWDAIWVYDHFHTVPTPEIETTFECWTITATLARDTKRVKIGQMVGCNGYRNPALYAKIASTVDVASQGRLYAGFGAGWYEHEWRAFGYQWEEIPARMGKFREAVEVIHKMWTEERPVFQGRHYQIDGPINEPKSAIPGRKIPLWIGGGGERVTLKLVAKYADACNVGGGNPDVCRQKLEILQRHCEEQGRDFSEITKSTSVAFHFVNDPANAEAETAAARRGMPLNEYSKTYLVGTLDDLAKRVEEVTAAGINYVIFYLPRVAYDQTPMHRIASEVIPQFA